MKTLIVKDKEMQRQPFENCHGGEGALDWKNVLGKKHLEHTRTSYIHDNVMAPGVSIGLHQHNHDEEYYYFITGTGLMTLDDKEFEVGPGDITAVYPGGKHALVNNSDEDMRFIVFSVKH